MGMSGLVAGLWLSRGWLPALVAVPTILLYWVSFPDTGQTGALVGVVLGALVGLAAWVVIGYLAGPSATPAAANRGVYNELVSRSRRIAAAVAIHEPDGEAPPDIAAAWDYARISSERVEAMLGRTEPDEGWASQESYIGVWVEIHRAEESLLRLRDPGEVAAEAEIDCQRLSRARMAGWEELRAKLEGAVRELRKDGSDSAAYATAQSVRRAINEYRDDRGAGLVRLRLNLRRWQLMLGVVVYFLFVAGILSVSPEQQLVQSFAAYYLIGAAAGLMLAAWRRRSDRPAVEDFGVASARLRLAPLLSGAAACGGAFLAGLLADNTLTQILAAESIQWDRLVLATNPALAIVAAAFGLAPGRLLGAVEKIGESLERDLSASEPTGADDGAAD